MPLLGLVAITACESPAPGLVWVPAPEVPAGLEVWVEGHTWRVPQVRSNVVGLRVGE